MSRNRYEEARGVLPLEWHNTWSNGEGYPTNRGVILVEVWRTGLNFWEANKPQVTVGATFELWVNRPVTGWHRIRSNGDLEPIAELPIVRRWASLLASRDWTETIALDGWSKP